jgi:hypothetical protein
MQPFANVPVKFSESSTNSRREVGPTWLRSLQQNHAVRQFGTAPRLPPLFAARLAVMGQHINFRSIHYRNPADPARHDATS